MFLKVDLNLLWTVLNIGVLYLLARRFLFTPLRQAMARRRDLIEGTLQQARDTKGEADRMKARGEGWLDQAHHEALTIIDSARERGDREYDRILEQARQAANRITEETRAMLAHEEATAHARVRRSAADLALAAAARLVEQRWSLDDERALVEQFCSEEQ